MRTKASAMEELGQELQDLPAEMVQAVVELLRAMKRSLAGSPSQGRVPSQMEKVVAHYQEKASGFEWGLVPDADYAEEVMEVYRSTFPRASVEP